MRKFYLRLFSLCKIVIWKLSLFRPTAFIAFFIAVVFFSISRKENVFAKGIFNKKWDLFPDSDVFNLYLGYGSFPLLYIIPHLFSHKVPSFLWIQRNRTIKAEYIPEHVNYLSTTPLSTISMQFILNRFAKKYKALLNSNSRLMLNIYIGEEAAHLYFIYPFIKNRIPNENITITIIDVGNGIFNNFNELMTSKVNWDYEYKRYSKLITALQKSYLPFIPAICDILGSKYIARLSIFTNTIVKNINYWLPITSYLCEPIPELKSVKNGMYLHDITPADVISKMSDVDKKSSLAIFGIDKEYYDKLFCTSIKPCLIITDSTVEHNEGRFHIVGEKIVHEYRNEFNIFYKAHPTKLTAHSSIETSKFLVKYGIISLPVDLPIEMLVYSYPNVYIGGYKSSIYMTIIGERVKFFITKSMKINSEAHTYSVIDDFYNKGVYKDAKIFWE